MSRRILVSFAALLAITALPAAPAVAKSKAKHQRPAKVVRPVRVAANEASTILRPSTGLGRVQTSSAPLSLPRDRGINPGKLRHIKVAPRRARRKHRLTIASDKTVGARVLLLAGSGNEPTFTWWKSMLTTEGVPFDAIVTGTAAPITTATLQSSDSQGRYESVILATGTLADCSVDPCADTMSDDSWTALQTYEKTFAVREIGAYGWPSPAYGTQWGGDCGDKSGITLSVTPAGAATFADLAGSFPTDKAVWGCETAAAARLVLADPRGRARTARSSGRSIRTDGVETMFNSIDGSDWTIHSQLLFHGMLNWVTKGVYLGTHRNYFGLDIDDVFLGNDRWDPATKALNPDENTVIRMVPSDVLRAVAVGAEDRHHDEPAVQRRRRAAGGGEHHHGPQHVPRRLQQQRRRQEAGAGRQEAGRRHAQGAGEGGQGPGQGPGAGGQGRRQGAEAETPPRPRSSRRPRPRRWPRPRRPSPRRRRSWPRTATR